MVINDPIGDMLMRIRNAGAASKESTLVPFSDLKFRVANVLMKGGYVTYVSKKIRKSPKSTMKVLEIGIAYDAPRKPRVKGMVRVSRPSRRMYMGAKDIRPVHQGNGMMILSTPKGILTEVDARKEHVGGEIICKVW